MNDSTPTTNAQGASRNLPACLQPEGELDVILSGTHDAARQKSSTRALHEKLCNDARNLRFTWHEFGFDHSEDAVLRHCVARHEEQDRFEIEARQQYQERPDDDDLVLGDFIPEDFRREARSNFARRAYIDNTNATAADDWGVFMGMRQQSSSEGMLGLPTGLPKLDEMLGGLRGLTFLGADKGVGKTSLTLFMVLAALRARADVAVLFYSLDMAKTRIYERLLCCEAGIDYRTLNDPQKSPQQEQCLAEATERLREEILPRLRVVERDFSTEVVDRGNGPVRVRKGLTFDGIIQDCRQLMESSGTNQVLIVVDLFQKIDPHGEVPEGTAADHIRLDVLDQVQKWSCVPARPHGFPILVTSEIRKDAPQENLSRDDLKGSGRIASDADVVLLMWPDESTRNAVDDVVPTTLRIGKGREGVRRDDLKLWFHHTRFRFYDEEPKTATAKIVPGNKKAPAADGSRQEIDPLAE